GAYGKMREWKPYPSTYERQMWREQESVPFLAVGLSQWNRTTRRTAMDSDHTSTSGVQASASTLDTHLPGRWMTAIHLIWAALIIGTLVLFFTSLPVFFAQLQMLCQTDSFPSLQLRPSDVQDLHLLRLTVQ